MSTLWAGKSPFCFSSLGGLLPGCKSEEACVAARDSAPRDSAPRDNAPLDSAPHLWTPLVASVAYVSVDPKR